MLNTPSAFEHELDDGATEVVESRPQRRGKAIVDTAQVARKPAAGGVSQLIGTGDSHRREFILIRRVGRSPAKIALAHGAVFKALWQIWESKRVQAFEDPGVTATEISGALHARAEPMAVSSIGSALKSLVKNEAARVVDQYHGFGARRTTYYPTEEGVQAFAMAEVLGQGSLVQVGRTLKAWRSRSASEPLNIFQHAALMRKLKPSTESA